MTDTVRRSSVPALRPTRYLQPLVVKVDVTTNVTTDSETQGLAGTQKREHRDR